MGVSVDIIKERAKVVLALSSDNENVPINLNLPRLRRPVTDVRWCSLDGTHGITNNLFIDLAFRREIIVSKCE